MSVCGYTTFALFSRTAVIFSVQAWYNAILALSVAIQLLASLLIALRLWWKSPRAVHAAHQMYMSVALTAVESGVVLTLATVVDIALLNTGQTAGALLKPIMSQLSVSKLP